jgi:hypothetical protein
MNQHSLLIKNLTPGLMEVGKLKIGAKGQTITSKQGKQFMPPTKLDYFRVTTLLRGPDDNYITDQEVHRLHGDKPKTIPVRLLYDQIELNFQCRYVCFIGKSMWCAGDGEAAWRLNGQDGKRTVVECPCGRQAPDYQGNDRCKINGVLSVIIDGVDRVGGVWKFRTTSYNSVTGILSSLALIKRITGGPLAGIPLVLTLNPKTVITPTDGRAMNVWVVGLEYRGAIQELQDIGYKQALNDAKHYERIMNIEEEARRLISHDPIRMDDEDPAEIVAEFYPEQMTTTVKDVKDVHDGYAKDPTVAATTEACHETATTGRFAGQESNGKGIDAPEGLAGQPGNGQTASTAQTPATVAQGFGETDPLVRQRLVDTGHLNGAEPAGRRRRANKYIVEPEQFGGKHELNTCGVTPNQLLQLKAAATDPESRAIIKEALANIGYGELSYLRVDEADDLLTQLHSSLIADAEPVPEAQQSQSLSPEQGTDPEPMIQCPYDGDRYSIPGYCLPTCHIRRKDGFCPHIEDPPPSAGGELL